MNPRAQHLRSVLVVLLALAPAGPAAAGFGPTDTILLRPAADDAGPAVVLLGPTRLQGDFGERLDAVLAAETDSAPPATETPALVAPAAPAAPAPKAEGQPSLILPVLGGAVGGTVGLYGGLLAGLFLTDYRGGDFWEHGDEILMGVMVSEIVLMPLGVHLGNARKGWFAADLGVSALGAAAGLGVLAVAGGTAGLLAGAGLQLALVTGAERHGAHLRIARRQADRVP